MKYIIEYDDKWPGKFQVIAKYLSRYLPDYCVIHHVGSTPIPGMPAKDIIDIDIECPDASIWEVIEALEPAGYKHQGDLGITSREAFKAASDEVKELPAHHLYACEHSSPELFRHIVFRDYLIELPAKAEWLGVQKCQADTVAVSRDEYIEKKSCAYEKVVKEALYWANKN